MSFRITIENVSLVGSGVWRTSLEPSATRLFGPGASAHGALNVLLVSNAAQFNLTAKTLSFRDDEVCVLNIGASRDAIIVQDSSSSPAGSDQSSAAKFTSPGGDKHFLNSLPPHLAGLGASLLREIRTHFVGDLVFHERSGKFVESPDNFWTVRIQPRDQSFRITVRGRPNSFSDTPSLELKDDMAGYSTFKIRDQKQVSDAIQIIREASNR
jgi:hypothetical protein